MFDKNCPNEDPNTTYLQQPKPIYRKPLTLFGCILLCILFLTGVLALGLAFASLLLNHPKQTAPSNTPTVTQTLEPTSIEPVTITSDSDTDDELVEVPNVVGLPLDQASQTLEDAGFSVASYGTITAYYTPGTVSDQSLKGWAPTGSTILLDYCKTYDEANHPEPSAIDNPDVHGLTIDQATELIAERGLPAPTEIDGPSDGIVTEYVHISETDTYALYTVSIEQ